MNTTFLFGSTFFLGQFDEGIEHDFGPALAQLLQRETDLLRLQLVVLSQDVDECTALLPLPAMISDVSGGVQGRTVASAVENSVFPSILADPGQGTAPLSATPLMSSCPNWLINSATSPLVTNMDSFVKRSN